MANPPTTNIKATKGGKVVTYRAGCLYLDGEVEDYCKDVRPLTATERAKVGTEYEYAAGRIVLTTTEATTLRAAVAEYEHALATERARPENVERRRIDAMHAKVDLLADYPGDSIPLHMEADRALEAWRIKYPEAARDEDRQALRNKANHERELASGALTYDADGSIGPAHQQQRHDEYMAKAAEYDRRAGAL